MVPAGSVAPMRLGVVILPEHRWQVAEPLWRRSEELGFHHGWTYDHLTWRTFRDTAWFAAVPQLAAAALATERMRIGTLVASPNFRHPVPFAKDLVTLDDLSGGRFTLGIGSGGVGWDATMLGHDAWPLSERAGRFEEFVALLDRLLTEREVTSEGRWYSADEARTYPGCVQSPRLPFAVAATGPRAMAVAARPRPGLGDDGRPHRTTSTPWPGRPLVAEQIEQLSAACAAVGRDPATIDRYALAGRRAGAGHRLGRGVPRHRGPLRGGGRHRPRRALAAPRRALPGDVDAFEAAVSDALGT